MDIQNSAALADETTSRFELDSPYAPAGDQPQAIETLLSGIRDGLARQTLLGVTGSGKTFTIANVMQALQRPTIVLAPNKTLAAQLYGEMREFFPDNSVEYFVSYYDYYQPEAYVPASDTYIEKDASINDHIEQMRLSATKALLERAMPSSLPPCRRSTGSGTRKRISAWCCTCAAVNDRSARHSAPPGRVAVQAQ